MIHTHDKNLTNTINDYNFILKQKKKTKDKYQNQTTKVMIQKYFNTIYTNTSKIH